MHSQSLESVLEAIDEANRQDPHREIWEGHSHPKEYLYGLRMSGWLKRMAPDADDVLQIAARGQHIRRWEVPRDRYPATREGYLQWRTFLYGFHGGAVAELMEQSGYPAEDQERVKTILRKRGIKTNPDVQLIEDVACLVFLEFYFVPFIDGKGSDKLVPIVRKTWGKMSEAARAKVAEIQFPESVQGLLAAALASDGASG